MTRSDYTMASWVFIAIAALFLAAMLWTSGCNRPLTPDNRAPSCDGTIAECCARACENLAVHECPGYRGSPGADDVYDTADDIGCRETCEYAASRTDLGIDMNLDCVARADSCGAVEKCPTENP